MRIRRLRASANAIADPSYRRLALLALSKRSNLEGAAAFAALVPVPKRASATRALVAIQSIYNYADTLAEQPDGDCQRSALGAHAALLLALGAQADELAAAGAPKAPDGAYLSQQIQRCQSALRELPSIDRVSTHALLAASDICSFQRYSSPAAPSGRLQCWARTRPRAAPNLSWWESAGAAGSSLDLHALIAAAASSTLDPDTVQGIAGAYGGPIGALHSLLDSLIDEAEDAETGQPSLIGFYPSRTLAAQSMGQLATRALAAARELPDGRRHAVLLAAMASMYLSDPLAAAPPAAPVREAVRAGIGALATPALAVFAVRRRAARHVGAPPREAAAGAESERAADACARVG